MPNAFAQSAFPSASGRAGSATYSDVGTLGDAFDTRTTTGPQITARQGFAGQLYEPKTLSLSANSASVVEGAATQLSATATMDDETLVRLGNAEPAWTVREGPMAGISTSGLATAGDVFINSPAKVRGAWQGAIGELTVIVLDTSVVPPGPVEPGMGFTAQAFSPAAKGTYQGILRDINGRSLGAIQSFTVTETGKFSAKVIFNGVTYPLSGTLLPNGSFTGSILRTGNTALSVTLQLGITTSGALTLVGTITGDGTTGTGSIAQAPFGNANPAPAGLVKSYTFLIPRTITGTPTVPEGEGFGSAKVSASGVITASGKTGDGVAFTSGGFLTADNQWHFFQPLYSSQGQIAGVLTFRDVAAVSDLDGPLSWIKNPKPANASYPLGFNLTPSFIGAIYTPPATGQRALSSLADQHYNARVTVAGLPIPNGGFAKTVNWLNTNAISYFGPETLSASLAASTGILTGSYRDPMTRLSVSFGGAVLQKQQIAGGNFLLANKAGDLVIEPGTNFGYPGSDPAGALPRITVPSVLPTALQVSTSLFSGLAAGSYGGLLKRGADMTGGLENVVIAQTGALSGTVIILGKRYAFKGTMGSDGKSTIVISRTGLPNITGELQLMRVDFTADHWQISGTFTADGLTHTVEASHYPTYVAVAPAAQAGRYTLAVRAPDAVDTAQQPGGDGYANLTVSAMGDCTGTLTLADGTRVTFGGRVSRSAEWFVHRSLYGTSGGYLVGKLTFRDVGAVSDLDGSLRWVKPVAVAGTTSYPGGFDSTRTLVGSRYTPPVTGQRAFAALTNSLYNGWVRLSGPDMSTLPLLDLTAVDRTLTWTVANQLLYYGPDKLTLSFSASTGLVTGTYVDSARKVNLSLGGALLQKQGLVTGRYAAGARTGLMVLQPR
ncbi:hypothetical protein [Brevifollis gellanilyticus]|uniref:Uncharacterized protein n=1 Tax=Brevifollis gellanilyticus TaxID=748831 RepID=A0A512MBL1_9BACT|nr:hypothetical protein [Brevifollis gellanilyticus]GEP43741.1 hypothetical protein BGE01nite_30320 [Brevifollis gellanilyticus]